MARREDKCLEKKKGRAGGGCAAFNNERGMGGGDCRILAKFWEEDELSG